MLGIANWKQGKEPRIGEISIQSSPDPSIQQQDQYQRRSKMLLRLCNPKPDLLKEVPRDLLRPHLGVKSRLASPEIGFRSLDELGLLVKLPEEEEAEVDRDDDVSTGKKC